MAATSLRSLSSMMRWSLGDQVARFLHSRDVTSANGAAPKLRSAPIFVSARARLAGNAAVARNRETVNPIAAVMPTTTRSPRCSPSGELVPARAREQQDADRFAEQQGGRHEVRPRANLPERHVGILVAGMSGLSEYPRGRLKRAAQPPPLLHPNMGRSLPGEGNATGEGIGTRSEPYRSC